MFSKVEILEKQPGQCRVKQHKTSTDEEETLKPKFVTKANVLIPTTGNYFENRMVVQIFRFFERKASSHLDPGTPLSLFLNCCDIHHVSYFSVIFSFGTKTFVDQCHHCSNGEIVKTHDLCHFFILQLWLLANALEHETLNMWPKNMKIAVDIHASTMTGCDVPTRISVSMA